MNAIFVIGDVDQNGEIDLEEFKRMMLPTSFDVVSKFRSVHKTTRDVQNAFKKFDANNDGSIDRCRLNIKSGKVLKIFLDLSYQQPSQVEVRTSLSKRLMLSSMLQMSTEMELLTMRSSSLSCVPQQPALSTNSDLSTRVLMMSEQRSKGNKSYV